MGYRFSLFTHYCLSCLFNAVFLDFFLQEKSNKEIDLTYKLKVLQQELEQEEASHKTARALLADKSKIKVTIEGAKSESMKGKGDPRILLTALPLSAHAATFTANGCSFSSDALMRACLPCRNGAEAGRGASRQTPVGEPNTGA